MLQNGGAILAYVQSMEINNVSYVDDDVALILADTAPQLVQRIIVTVGTHVQEPRRAGLYQQFGAGETEVSPRWARKHVSMVRPSS